MTLLAMTFYVYSMRLTFTAESKTMVRAAGVQIETGVRKPASHRMDKGPMRQPKLRARAATETTSASPVIEVSRRIKPQTTARLYARAAGRCEFCNKDTLAHSLTQQDGTFAEQAHIVAFKEDGPRGTEGHRPTGINALENLMLLCLECHELIDGRPQDYRRSLLERLKREHEERIRRLTELGPDRKTSTIVVAMPIGGHRVVIKPEEVFDAVTAQHRYPIERHGTVIDLGALVGAPESESYLGQGRELIDRHLDRVFAPGGGAERAGHLSVFALSPIPLLVHLGARLSTKVAAELFQRHRDTEDWNWKTEGPLVSYRVVRTQDKGRDAPVALVLALSGAVPLDTLPSAVRDHSNVYMVTLDGADPNPASLRQKGDLDRFRLAFQYALAIIATEHGLRTEIDLIPAVPAPVAVLCGRERLPKVHPGFRVFDRQNGEYHYKLTVN
jgi:hypothetical protein